MALESRVIKPLCRMISWSLLAFWLILSAACTKDAAQATDANDNADTGPSAQEKLCADYPDNIACPTLPAPPQLEDGTDFSEWEPSQCPAGAMPDFGKPGCIVIGDPCPEGDWPEDLPTDNIRFVTPGGTGDGRTKETAAGSIQQMLDDTAPISGATLNGYTIALSKGRFEEHFEIGRRQHVVGACARDTVIAGLDASRQQVVGMTGSGESSLRSVTVTGATIGVIIFSTSAEVSISGILIERATQFGFVVSGASVAAAKVVVRDTQSLSNGSFGRGIRISEGAQVSFTEGFVSGNRELGVVVGSPGTIATFENVVIEDTQERASDGSGGRGLSIQEGASVTFTRGLVSGNRQPGVGVYSESIATFEDVVIENTQEEASNGSGGRGMEIGYGAQLSFTRGLVSGNRDVGVLVSQPGTIATFEDVVIEDTQERASDGSGGRGLEVSTGASVSFIRGLVSGNRDIGVIVVLADTIATFEDVVIEKTKSQESDGRGGRGLEVSTGTQVSLTRGLVSGNRELGVFLGGKDTSLQMRESIVTGTKVAFCAEDPALTCPFEETQGFGDGILVLGGAHLELQDFEITDNARVGLYLYDTEDSGFDAPPDDIFGAPTLDVLRGTITRNPYGINFRQGNITPADFSGKEVACYDNGATVDGCYSEVQLEVPSPSEALEGVTK